ncbi:hypothetical protein [Alistipes indistinctus]|uniref:hypothetical protein n=1 Tax=Alistipes indistinctus TaxID=626932 RepID=UPI0036F44DDB
MKNRTLYDPLTNEFTKYGDKFEKIAHNEASGMYCYKRTTSDGLTYYEVFKAPKAKDENTYERYPSYSGFGFGTAICIRGNEKQTQDRIACKGFEHGRYGIL